MNAAAIATVALAAFVLYVLTTPRAAAAVFEEPDYLTQYEPDQLPTVLETLATSMDPSTWDGGTLPGDLAGANVAAFLDMLAVSEGTAGRGDRGYNVLFGGGTFDSYADHPRQLITRTFGNGLTVTSSAAGRYQFLRRTWDDLAPRLGLPDFSPASQDLAACELIRQRGAMADVEAGRFTDAVRKCAPTWASLPGAGYGQPEHNLSRLVAAFTSAGGTITA